MTLDALVAIIALGAGGLIVVILAIAYVEPPGRDEPMDDAASRAAANVLLLEVRSLFGGAGQCRRLQMPHLGRRRPRHRRRVRGSARGVVGNEEERVALGVELVQQLRRAPRRPTWHGITNASTAWRHKLSHDLLYLRARARRWARRRGLDEGDAAWVAAAVALSLALAYLIVHS